ncbi:major facilitator superfamily domain-containing protein [Emericellopsis atlantica]|uniref:Major facilitator superfamily domain-containing protein n=1 Tax=Emericellopsis atlantica TaxID=2614577 RepID=A0A9P8CQJ6_9HYPO|nr:major facilitator superfamily domain-containing protein [Emericellopsis atlantica]KAG9256004.1 major facilitator superfamily domain-containing protein [Emericellopsis atlantica]
MSKSITSVEPSPLATAKEHASTDMNYPPEVAALMKEFTGAKYTKLMRKLDMRLIPIVSILDLIMFVNADAAFPTGNIANARLAGLEEDLGMEGDQYNVALTIFFVSYIVFEVPANMALKYLSPRIWITLIAVSWGLVMTLMGLVHNYEGLLAARFMLGVPEAGIFPAAAYYITIWYSRHEAMYRTALFYATASLAGAFSGLLAYAITLMDGIGGLAGWQWIFILEGILTALCGSMAYFTIYNGPDSVSWLTDEEKAYIKVKLAYDGNRSGMGASEEGSKKKYIKDAFCDWQVYLSVVIYLGISVSTYGIVFGLPTIVSTLGYTDRAAQLMTIPPYVTACILTIVVAHLSDRLKRRGYFIAGSLAFALVGFIIAITTAGHANLAGVTYAGCFIACCGFFPAFPGVISWLANNLAGPYKRAIAMSLQICKRSPYNTPLSEGKFALGNTGGLIGSNIYLAREKPRYTTGYGISIGFISLAIVATGVMMAVLSLKNKKRDRYVEQKGGPDGVVDQHGDVALTEMGDKSPLFRYTL